MDHYLGIDIGGSYIKSAIIDGSNSLLSFSSTKTIAGKIAKTAAEEAKKIIDEANLGINDITGCGIGVPGIIENTKGKIIYAPNVDLCDVDIISDFISELKKISKTFPAKNIFSICNDADCAGLAEAYLGAGVGHENILLLTLGTGVGGSAIFGGKPLPFGKYGGEFGHFPFISGGRKCSCGLYGCFEQYANAKASHEFTFDEYCKNLALGICGLVNILRPDIVVLAGGVTNEGQKLFDAVNKMISSNAYAKDIIVPPKVVCTKLGKSAGAVGAALAGKLYLRDLS